MSTESRRATSRRKGLPTWRIIRYADDFVVLVHGRRQDAEALREEVAMVLAPLGLRLSPAKTRVVHLSDGFDFVGFHIRWRRKRGTDTWHVYTFIAQRPIRSVKAKIRALTYRKSQQDLGSVLRRLNLIMHGWANYFQHAVAKRVFEDLAQLTWRRLIAMLMVRHHWRWKDIRRWLVAPDGSWRPISAGGIELFNMASTPVTRYRWRGSRIPNPWILEHV
jgi:RNA-directed DNA polymerase